MGESIVSTLAGGAGGALLGKVLGGSSPRKAQAREASRLASEAEANKAEMEQKRKAKALTRPQTDVFGSATTSTAQGNTLGG